MSALLVFYDVKTDTATIALRGGIGPCEIVRCVPAFGDKIYLEFNAAGQLISIELRDMDMLHPDLARDAIQIRAGT